ncbi:MAG: DUF192 domain-containing protein [Acidimicrobiia bacterium]
MTPPGSEQERSGAGPVDLAVGLGKILRPWLIGLVLGLGALAGLLYGANRPADPAFPSAQATEGGFTWEERRIQVGESCILVQVADTPEKRSQGLRGRESMGIYDGMLFEFEQTSNARFTMSGVKFPLTIGFYDAAGTQVDAVDMEPCPENSINCPTYGSKAPFDNAIEVEQGELPGGSYTGNCPA